MANASSPICTETITGPAAWRSSDFTDPAQWTTPLTADDIGELFAALKHSRDTGKELGQITRADFPLDGLAEKLKDVSRTLVSGRGFAVLSGFPITADIPRSDIELMYWGLCAHLGPAVTQNARGEIIVPVKNYGNGGLLNATTRGYQTNEALPFHTDSSDVVGLLCLRSAGEGGYSSLASSVTIHNELLAHHRELLGLYYAGFYYDRRDEQLDGERPYYRNSVYAWHEGRLTCRYYVRHFIESAAERFDLDLSAVERLALHTFESIADRPENKVTMRINPGDIQFLNNNVIVHARTAFVDGDQVARELLRVWLNPFDAPTPPPGHAAFREGMPQKQIR
ncbi:alpha-ketoglutarate-dependent taurine dioxygenase [Nocardia tenerifensis]|uniref:Alpha-ketoglutarate-dependent taurine dioxygenase n=1 Tax=Nocardia tenerifensis TaxID=228006 RepID=A0A318KG66_9NOCA|nr:TauD/TfdA family dioxygenase [Nocardia tenerifensis]PXX71252.1 alpha-ketoglutarate-dependent taurine dioxygenase [Nocardia tenerifensis]